MTAFLVQQAELRMLSLEALQCGKRVGDAIQASQICSHQILDIAVIGRHNCYRFGCG
jgi:hypothetical protein